MPNTPVVSDTHHVHRLPCRGCQADCKQLPLCNGRPWRMDLPMPDAKQEKKP